MNLYWLTSKDHSEDWFVVANSNTEASQFFADNQGFDLEVDKVEAKFICELQKEVTPSPAYPSTEELKACGAVIKQFDDIDLLDVLPSELWDTVGVATRIVLLDGDIYIQGSIARIWKTLH